MQEIQEIQVQSLGQEDPLEEMATHSGNLCHGQRSLMGYSPLGHKELDTHTLATEHGENIIPQGVKIKLYL